MTQSIAGIGLKGTGIVAVLIIAGIALTKFGIATSTGDFAIKAGVTIGIILGLLGIFGILKRLAR